MQDANDDTRRTIHDCTGSLALLPNEPMIVPLIYEVRCYACAPVYLFYFQHQHTRVGNIFVVSGRLSVQALLNELALKPPFCKPMGL